MRGLEKRVEWITLFAGNNESEVAVILNNRATFGTELTRRRPCLQISRCHS